MKYKVNFKEKGRSLVSGHHIAFEHMPKVNELLVGARVVVRSKDDQFVPGFMAEVPSRKNRMRLVCFTLVINSDCEGGKKCKIAFNFYIPGS